MTYTFNARLSAARCLALVVLALAGLPALAQNQAISSCESAVDRAELTLIATGVPVSTGPDQFLVPLTVTRGDGAGAFEVECRYDGRIQRATLGNVPGGGGGGRASQQGARDACVTEAQARGFNVARVINSTRPDPNTWLVVLSVPRNNPPTIECMYDSGGSVVIDAQPAPM
jgi:hypothetical protein